MNYVLLIFFELLILYFLSQTLTKKLSHTLFSLIRSKTISVYLFSLIFLPGTIFHELSHFLMAKVLFVYTGKIHLIPKLEKTEIRMGTVAVGKSDPIRRFLIGAAPFIFGSILLVSVINYAIQYSLFKNYWFLAGLLYLIFQVGNSMFSSKKDMEGTLKLLFVTAIIVAIMFFLGIRISINDFLASSRVLNIFQKSSLYLFFPIAFDLLILFILRIFTRK